LDLPSRIAEIQQRRIAGDPELLKLIQGSH
jgi:hypothetical protein